MYVESLLQFGSFTGSVYVAMRTSNCSASASYRAAAWRMSPRASSSGADSESTTSPAASAVET